MGRKSVSIELKKNIILLRDIGISQHVISRQLKISRRYICQTIRKFDRFHNVATKPGAGRPQKVTDREKRLIYRMSQKFCDIRTFLFFLFVYRDNRFILYNLNRH